MGVPDHRRSPRELDKNQFVELTLRLQYFLHQKYPGDEIFDIVLSVQMGPPKSIILNGLSQDASFFEHQ